MISIHIKEICKGFTICFNRIVDVENAFIISSSQIYTLIQGLEQIKKNNYNIYEYDYQKYLFYYMINGNSCYSQHHQQLDDDNDNNDESYKFWTRIFCGVMSIYDNNNNNNNINNNDNNNISKASYL